VGGSWPIYLIGAPKLKRRRETFQSEPNNRRESRAGAKRKPSLTAGSGREKQRRNLLRILTKWRHRRNQVSPVAWGKVGNSGTQVGVTASRM